MTGGYFFLLEAWGRVPLKNFKIYSEMVQFEAMLRAV